MVPPDRIISRPLVFAALLTSALGGACGHGSTENTKMPVHPMLRAINAQGPTIPTAPKNDQVTIAPASASPITFARMAKFPEPGWNVPRGVQHAPPSPNGSERLITYLASESGDDTMSLFMFDTASGKSDVLLRPKDITDGSAPKTYSREEELRRERQRDRNEGITQHIWARRAKVLIIPHGGDIFVRDWVKEPSGSVRRLTKTPEPEIDPKPCESGERVSFVRKGELYSIDVANGKETMLSTPAPKDTGITHGLSDYVGQEEMGESSGHFWSPKCDRLVYLEVDDRQVDKLPVFGYRGEPDLMMQRYPRAGTKNPIVRAGIVDIATKKTTWLDWKGPLAAEKYMGRWVWAEDGKTLFVQTLTRDQKKLSLVRVDPQTGATTEIATESSPAWIQFSPMRVLKKSNELLFTSIKSGHRHLEVRSQKDGAVVRTLTNGTWDVDGILGLDDNRVLFAATKEGPIQRHLYGVPLAGGEVTKLTAEHGSHGVKVDESGTTWVDVHSGTDRPPKAVIVRDGKPVGELPIPADPEIQSLGIRPVEHLQVPSPTGEMLNAVMLRPRKIEGRHPAIVMVYGGPESQLVHDSWAPHLQWQHLADRGFVIFQLDNRGTGGRGREFAHKVHKQLGKLELEDQIAGAKWLAQQPFVDGARIGIYGHSYGGFMAALAMLDGKGVFKAGVAGSPVTDWRLYDTAYTERYMETPQTNAAGYEASDLTKKAAGLSGKLLLTHAMMDENVHYANTAKLIDALIAANKRFDLLVLPGERHGLRAPAAKVYMPERIATYFAESL